ncbi:MAG: helix-turn-helix domain-containing protein [Microbacterium sp.]|uniref:PucR family transcriptional regulator n=1 Tax=Microbacterium sp. TaxID=51671 RepID=UPI0039E63617
MSELSLDGILAHPDAADVDVLERGATVWRDVQVELDESGLRASSSGFALLLAPEPTTPWAVDALIRRVSDLGVTGLAFPATAPIGDSNRALAARLGMTLLRSTRPTRLAAALWQLVEGRDAVALGLVRRVALSIGYQAETISDLLRHLAANLGHGVALVDRDGVLASGGPLPGPGLLSLIDSTKEWIDLASGPEGSVASVAVHSPTRPGVRLVVHGGPMSDTQLRALGVAVEVAMPAVAARILIDQVNEIGDASRSSSLLGDFLEQPVMTAELEQRMLELGWRATGWHAAFRLTGRTYVDPLDILRAVNSELPALSGDASATVRGAGVTGWLTFAEQPTPAELQRVVGRVRHLHNTVRAHLPIATGVGTLASGAAGLARSIGEAHDAAQLALGREESDWFVQIDRFGLEQLLLAWTRSATFRPTAASLFAPLGDVDRRTLQAFLDHESSSVRASAALGVHRNTLAARMRRIEEALGVALDDPDTRLALHLAVRALRDAPPTPERPRTGS